MPVFLSVVFVVGYGDLSLEKSMTTHSSILAWRIPKDREACLTTAHEVAKILTRLSD